MTLRQPEPLVGRDTELALLVDALAANRPVLVTGEAGIGKTSLVREGVARAGRNLVQGGGFATLATMPYLALRLALGAPVAGDPAAVARRVESVVEDGVLFLDDLHWVDRETLAVVPLLLGRIAIVAASRDRSTTIAADLPAGLVTTIRLGPLAVGDAEAVVRRQAPDVDPATMRHVVARAAGNPLVLAEIARHGRESRTVARAIAGHLDEATAEARQALRLLAVADRPLPAIALADTEVELLELGLAAREGETISIRHGLIAETILAGLSEAERRVAHEAVAELADDHADAALHLARAGHGEAAVARAMMALERATDPRERAALLRIAAEAADSMSSTDLRLAAARAALDVEDAQAAIDLLQCEIDGNPEQQGLRLAVLAAALAMLGRSGEADAAIADGRRLALDPSGEAAHRLAFESALAHANQGEARAAIETLESVDRADIAGESWRRAARNGLRATLVFFAGGEPDIGAMRAAVDAAIHERDPAALGRAVNLHSILLGTSGPAAALAFATEIVVRLDAAGLDDTRLRAEQIQTLAFTGRPADAVVVADELLESPTPFLFRAWTMSQRAEALTQLGRFADAEDTLRQVEAVLTDEWVSRGEALVAAAHLAYWSGRPRDAAMFAGRALATPTSYGGNYLLPALTRAWAQADLGLSPEPVPDAPVSWAQRGAAAEWSALHALTTGSPAVGAFDEATVQWNSHHVLRAAVCRWAAGEAARREGKNDAVDRLRNALGAAEAHGLTPLAGRIRRSLRLAGVRLPSPPPRESGRGLLTAREREVLSLVAGGQSNIEMARRLGLGRPTVTRILSNAMAKLGAETRAQAILRMRATG